MIRVEVAYALPERQELRRLELPRGTTAREAVRASGMAARFPGLDPETAELGIFGRPVASDTVLTDGDRVEIYRPLLADPRIARRRRAAHRSRHRR